MSSCLTTRHVNLEGLLPAQDRIKYRDPFFSNPADLPKSQGHIVTSIMHNKIFHLNAGDIVSLCPFHVSEPCRPGRSCGHHHRPLETCRRSAWRVLTPLFPPPRIPASQHLKEQQENRRDRGSLQLEGGLTQVQVHDGGSTQVQVHIPPLSQASDSSQVALSHTISESSSSSHPPLDPAAARSSGHSKSSGPAGGSSSLL